MPASPFAKSESASELEGESHGQSKVHHLSNTLSRGIFDSSPRPNPGTASRHAVRERQQSASRHAEIGLDRERRQQGQIQGSRQHRQPDQRHPAVALRHAAGQTVHIAYLGIGYGASPKGGAPLNIAYTPYLFKSKEDAAKTMNGLTSRRCSTPSGDESGVRGFAAASACPGRTL